MQPLGQRWTGASPITARVVTRHFSDVNKTVKLGTDVQSSFRGKNCEVARRGLAFRT